MNLRHNRVDVAYPILLFGLLILLKYKSLSLPYYWDALNYVIPTINYINHNLFTPFLWDYNLGHPPFFFWFVAALFKVFGTSNIVANLSVVFFSFLALYFTYLMGKELFSRKVGIIASLLLLFTPIFFSYSGMLFLSIPLVAFSIATVYFAIRSKPLPYFIFGSLSILTEMTGILIIMGVTLAKLIKEKKINKNVVIYALPSLIFLFWIVSNKIYYGYYLYPIDTSVLHFHIIKTFLNFLIILKIIFFDQFRWILTSIFVLSFVNFKKINFKEKSSIVHLFLTFIFFLFLYNLNNFIGWMRVYFPNIGIYLDIIKSFSILFSILFLLILFSYKDIIKNIVKNKFLEIIVPLFVGILFFVFIIPLAPRYILFLFPLVFLFFAIALNVVFKNYSYIVMLIVIIIFSLNFFGDRSTVGFALETNMEYVDAVKTQILGAHFIEDNFPNSTVLTAFPLSSELIYPYGGYVKNPINVVTSSHFEGMIGNKKNYTHFLNPELYHKPLIDVNSIDLYYYSPQQTPSEDILDIANKLNLTLIKRFELNNKFVEIYRVNK